jgi:hypothetical protein
MSKLERPGQQVLMNEGVGADESFTYSVSIRIADGEFLDYLNACARLRTQTVKVELLVELCLL